MNVLPSSPPSTDTSASTTGAAQSAQNPTPGPVKGAQHAPSALFTLLLSGQLHAAPGAQTALAAVVESKTSANPGVQTPSAPTEQTGKGLPLADLLAAILAGGTVAATTADAKSAKTQDKKSAAGDVNAAASQVVVPIAAPLLLAATPHASAAPQSHAGADDASLATILNVLSAGNGGANSADVLKAVLAKFEAAQAPASNVPTQGAVAMDRGDVAALHAAVVHQPAQPASGDAGARPAAVPSVPVDTPMQKPGWDRELGNRVVWMAKDGVQAAQLRVNPPHLGPVEVRLSVSSDAANVSFIAHHVHARDAIEAAIPRLREMMAEQGFAQTNVNVGGHGAQQGQGQQAFSAPGAHANPFDTSIDTDALPATSSIGAAALGMVDYFA